MANENTLFNDVKNVHIYEMLTQKTCNGNVKRVEVIKSTEYIRLQKKP